MKKDEKIIELRRFSSSIEAEMAQGVLRGAGINCQINDYLMDTIYPMEALRTNSIRLLVDEKDEKLANEILNADFLKEE